MNQKILTTLLLAALASTVTAVGRPKEVPSTCDPMNQFSCPTGLTCIADRAAGIGYCNCFTYYGYIRDPPKITDGLDDPYTCSRDWSIWWLHAVFQFVIVCAMTHVLVDIYRKFHYLVKTKQYNPLKANGRLLIYLTISATASEMAFVIYFLNIVGLDPKHFMHDNIRPFIFPFLHIASITVSLELPALWIDVVMKAVTMSRKSSKGLIVTQYILKTLSLVGFAHLAYRYLTGAILTAIFEFTYFYNAMVPITCIAGYLIRRILCPKMDKNHTNFKSAQAIKTYCWKYCASMPCSTLPLILYVHYIIRAGTWGYYYVFFIMLYEPGAIYFVGHVNEYIMYGYRKALKDYNAAGGQSKGFKDLVSTASAMELQPAGRKSILDILPKVGEGEEPVGEAEEASQNNAT